MRKRSKDFQPSRQLTRSPSIIQAELNFLLFYRQNDKRVIEYIFWGRVEQSRITWVAKGKCCRWSWLKLLPPTIVPTQPTLLSALLDRPGLQLLYSLIRPRGWPGRRGGLWGRLHEHPPRSQPSSHCLAPSNHTASLAQLLFMLCCPCVSTSTVSKYYFRLDRRSASPI